MAMREFEDEYSESLESEFREIRGALLGHTIRTLEPEEPIRVAESTSVRDAVAQMMSAHQAAVLIVDGDGRLTGIFTERDVLSRVVAQGRDVEHATLAEVMTRNPEALSVKDRIAYAVNQMSVAGYRTIPLVDDHHHPIGIVSATHVIKWMAGLFPEAVLNLRPGDTIKHPSEVDAG
jgi:signal-transduction protein with cAMP-binding, CBS, and nucleotidyltransferase domain